MEEKIKVQFIGTGNFYNLDKRANASLLLYLDNKKLLIDCGPTTIYQLQKAQVELNSIEGILFTHFHGDHFIGVVFLDLAYSLDLERKEPIIYGGPQGLEEHFKKSYNICFENTYFYNFERKFVEFIPYHSYNILENIEILPIPMKHKKESLGYRIKYKDKIIAITGDTGWTSNILELSKHSDILITECELFEENPELKHHLSYRDIEKNLENFKTKSIYLIHIGKEFIFNKNKIKENIIKIGEDLLTIEI